MSDMTPEQMQHRITELTALTQRRYREMSIPLRRVVTDWVTLIVPDDLKPEDLELIVQKVKKAGDLLIVPEAGEPGATP